MMAKKKVAKKVKPQKVADDAPEKKPAATSKTKKVAKSTKAKTEAVAGKEKPAAKHETQKTTKAAKSASKSAASKRRAGPKDAALESTAADVKLYTGKVTRIGQQGKLTFGWIDPDDKEIGEQTFNKSGVNPPTVFGPKMKGKKVRFHLSPIDLYTAIDVELVPDDAAI